MSSQHWIDEVARGLARGTPRRALLRWAVAGLMGAALGQLPFRTALARVFTLDGTVQGFDGDVLLFYTDQFGAAGSIVRILIPADLRKTLPSLNRGDRVLIDVDDSTGELVWVGSIEDRTVSGVRNQGRATGSPEKDRSVKDRDSGTSGSGSNTTTSQNVNNSNSGSAKCSPFPTDPLFCSYPFLCCDSSQGCIDSRSDPEHCGACNNPCSLSMTCENSKCVCPTISGGVTCGSGRICCPLESLPGLSECVDPLENVNHCGGCGRQCSVGTVCSNGTCKTSACEGVTCTGGLVCCREGTDRPGQCCQPEGGCFEPAVCRL